jgi:hypothetical protein
MTGASHDAWCREANRDQRAGRHGDWSITGNVYWCDTTAQHIIGQFVENSVDSASGLLATRANVAIGGTPVLVHSRQGTWDGRTVAAALAILIADAADQVMTVTSEEDAISELAETGFSVEIATQAVAEYVDGGGEFNVEDDDSQTEVEV